MTKARRVADPDDDSPKTGQAVQDPLLRVLPVGPDREPPRKELEKRPGSRSGQAATGAPPAGLTTVDQARRAGPLGVLQVLGPGLITGASDDDPSGIGTYSQVGSQFGLGLLWTALFTFPLMLAMQELCARIALQTGVGLGVSLRRKFPIPLVGTAVLALLVANTFNLGADLGAVAAGLQMLTGGHLRELWLVAPVALLIVGLQMFVSYAAIFRIFKWLTLALFAYVITGLAVHPAVVSVLIATVVPHVSLSPPYIQALVAVFGTTISPYLFFWQASSEVDEMRAAGKLKESERRGIKVSELRAARLDIAVGMFFSNIVMYFIVLTTAATLHAHGQTGIQTADQAAQALAPLAGPFAFILFAVGIVGTGLLAIPILSGSAAYAVREFLGLRGSLAARARYRPTFYAVMLLATAAGVAMNFVHLDPIRALFVSAILNGLVAPPLMILIVLLGADRRVMRDKVSGRLSLALTGTATIVMAVAAMALLATTLHGG